MHAVSQILILIMATQLPAIDQRPPILSLAPEAILRPTPQVTGQRACSLDEERYLVTFSIRTSYRNTSDRPVTVIPVTETFADATYGPTRDAFRTRIGLVSAGDLVVLPEPDGGQWPGASFKTLRPGESHDGHVEIPAVVASRGQARPVQDGRVRPGAQFVEVTTVLLSADGSAGASIRDDLRFTYVTSEPIPVSVPQPGAMRPCSEVKRP